MHKLELPAEGKSLCIYEFYRKPQRNMKNKKTANIPLSCKSSNRDAFTKFQASPHLRKKVKGGCSVLVVNPARV